MEVVVEAGSPSNQDDLAALIAREPLFAPGEVYPEHQHYSHRAPWIRAAVLGGSDGLVSVGALVMGVGASAPSQRQLLLAAISASVAGALSMFVGEYVSVAQQADTEKADVEKERACQAAGPGSRALELMELTEIYVQRGLDQVLAAEVAKQLTERDAIRAHARDELGIDIDSYANPLQAAMSSGISFLSGSAIPTLLMFIPGETNRLLAVLAAVSFCLFGAGSVSAHLGGASKLRGSLRMLVGGWVAMGTTFAIGRAFGTDASK